MSRKVKPTDLRPILDVASRYTELKESPGAGYYYGKCPHPDHDDSSPSFVVWPEVGLWKCYGCDTGGDAANLIAFMEEISYLDALKQVWAASQDMLTLMVERLDEGCDLPDIFKPPEELTWGEILERLQSQDAC